MGLSARGSCALIGESVGGYRIMDNLGSGSMGTVYRAEEPFSGRLVAVKVVKSMILYDAPKRERFLQGILAAAEVKHAGICPILEIGDREDDFFVVMPLLEGRTLAQALAGKPMPWQGALGLCLKIGEALEAGHAAGAVHRGIKPANVWMQHSGQPLVLDFNLARFTEMGEGGSTGSRSKEVFAATLIPMGALASMSPEQVHGDPVDLRTDIFSFGAMLYEMLTGHHPFESRSTLSRMHAILEGVPLSPSSLNPDIPRALDPILLRALAKKPDDRFNSMGPLLDALRRVLNYTELRTAPGIGDTQTPKPAQMSHFVAWIGIGIVGLLALLIYYLRR